MFPPKAWILIHSIVAQLAPTMQTISLKVFIKPTYQWTHTWIVLYRIPSTTIYEPTML